MDTSLLFRLPQELRDQIYEYVLHQSPGVLYQSSEEGADNFYRRTMARPRRSFINWLRSHWSRSRLVERARGPENNQLKYVCRRLYYETRGMDLRCNWIVFRDSASLSAVQQSVLLFRRCSLLRRFVIMSSPESFTAEYGQLNLSELIGYCTADPAVMVRVHIPYWSQANPNFVFLGLAYLFTLRGDASLITRLAQSTSVSYLSDSVSEILTTSLAVPPNFRFFPREESLDIDAVQCGLRRSTMPNPHAAIGDVRKLVEQWFMNGL
ncbi:hypothetical protein K505DRAFT_261048 [Melanomma pulvis-pyrius CBS 109.77]|uniref:Uncharacterized protein n=1 Tax=Melanomma pulvis-pyrius CBS 109.77 TaxID=1314802 RepID=A0A6A6WPY5_9PLEO|nr:hypothetical protein K505DRAFT_261048 [Melanomma pulvis-pyrius CBS 109.77]